MRTLLLDIGGVFYLGRPDAAFWARWAGEARMAPAALRLQFWHGPDIEAANVGAIDAAEYHRRAGARMGLSPDLVAAMTEEAFLSEPNHAFADFVRGLRAEGLAVSALTNSWSSEAALKARPLLAGLFDQVISSRDVGLAKPDPAIFRLALRRLGVAAGEVLFVDDTPGHVEVGRTVGIGGLCFEATGQACADIRGWMSA